MTPESAIGSSLSPERAKKAGPFPGMAGRTRGFDKGEQGVSVTVDFHFHDPHCVAACLSFFPKTIA